MYNFMNLECAPQVNSVKCMIIDTAGGQWPLFSEHLVNPFEIVMTIFFVDLKSMDFKLLNVT